MNKSVLLTVFGCALLLGTFNCQAMNENNPNNEKMQISYDALKEPTRIGAEPLINYNAIYAKITATNHAGKADQYLQLAKEYVNELKKTVQDNILHSSSVEDKNITASNKCILKAVNYMETFVGSMPNFVDSNVGITQNIEKMTIKLEKNVWNVLRCSEYALWNNKSLNEMENYIYQIYLIKNIMQICEKIKYCLYHYIANFQSSKKK